MGTRHLTSKFLTSTSFVALLFALLVVFPYSASAIEPTFNVVLSSLYDDVYFQDGNSTTWRHSNAFYMYGNNADYSSNNRLFTLSNSNHAVSIPATRYVTVTGSFVAYSNIQDQFNSSGTFGLSSQNTDCEVIDFDLGELQATNNSGTQQLTYKADWTLTCRLKSAVSVGPTLPLTVNTVSNPGVSQVGILFTNFAFWYTDVNNTQLYQAINQVNTTLGVLGTMNTTLSNLYSNAEDQLDALNDLRSAQEQSNDDANARYQDEKDTINNSASSAQSNASGQDFSFSLPNPFTAWFGGFSDNECVDIPNLAVWLHWDGDYKLGGAKRVCSPWPSDVRTVMTTIVSGMLMLVLFGFIINWVKKNDTGGD